MFMIQILKNKAKDKKFNMIDSSSILNIFIGSPISTMNNINIA